MENKTATLSVLVSELEPKDFLGSLAPVIEQIENGEQDPLKIYVRLKAIISECESVLPGILDKARDEAEKYGQKRFKLFGATVEIKEVGTKWIFDQTNDPIYFKANSELQNAKTACSEREKFLKTLKEPMTFVDEETGETIKIFPPRKESKSGIAISF